MERHVYERRQLCHRCGSRALWLTGLESDATQLECSSVCPECFNVMNRARSDTPRRTTSVAPAHRFIQKKGESVMPRIRTPAKLVPSTSTDACS